MPARSFQTGDTRDSIIAYVVATGTAQNLLDDSAGYVGLGEPELAVLHEIAPLVEPYLDELADVFYGSLLSRPRVQALFEDSDQINRLKRTLRRWASEFFTRPRDADYLKDRLRIGEIHHRIGVTDLYVVGAMGIVRRYLIEIIDRAVPAARRSAARDAVEKAADVDLILMTESFHKTARVHEMEEGHRRLRLVLEQAPVAVFIYDRDANVTEWNPAAERLFGFTRDEVIRRGPFETFALPEDRDLIAGMVGRVFSGEEVRPVDRTHRTRDGRIINTIVAQAPILFEGEVRESAAFCLDVTELTTLREKMIEQEKMAALGTLAAGLAHEVGNPLASISAICQVIQMKATDPKLSERITTIHEAINRIDSIVRNVLSFARPREEVGSVAIGSLAKEALDLVLMDRRLKRVAVRAKIPPELPSVQAPRNGIVQVLINLLFNAADSLNRVEDPEIQVIAIEERGGVTVSVRDNGPGFDTATIHRAKEPFFSTKEHGTGLGLAISYGIIERCRGRMTLGNHAAGGAIVTVWLPAA